MLKFKDSKGKTKFVLRDLDTEPISIDELVLQDDLNNDEDDLNESDKNKKESVNETVRSEK